MTIEHGRRRLTTWLFNPFVYVAGWQAFLVGLLIIIAAGYIGFFSDTHFDGVIDVHSGLSGPRWIFLSEGLIDWLCMSAVLWVFGKCVSKTAFRAVDLFGTQATARWPFAVTSVICLLPGYTRFTQYVIQEVGGQGKTVPFQLADAIMFGGALITIVLMLCWSVALMFRSYAVCCNIRGGKAAVTFVMAIIFAEVLSKAILIPIHVSIQQDQKWKTRADEPPPATLEPPFQHERHYAFDDDKDVQLINGDKGLSVEITDGEARIYGTTADSEWGPESVKVSVPVDAGAVEVSGRFRIETREASGLVFLEAETQDGGPLIYMYQWFPLFQVLSPLQSYQIQTRWFHIPAKLVSGVGSMRVPGDPELEFCTMRIRIREDHKTVDYFANDVFQDSVVFEKPFGPIVSAKMELQTPRKGYRFDIRFDDLMVKWNDSPLEAERVEMEKKTGGLLLRYTFDEGGDIVKDVSGQMCDGEVQGGPQWVDGIEGGALAVDGEGDAVIVPVTRRLHDVQNSNFTVMAWFCPLSNPKDNSGNGFGIVVKPGSDVGLIRDNRGVFRFTRYFYVEPSEGEERSGEEPSKAVWIGRGWADVRKWYHLAGVVLDSGRRSRLYINGELVAEESDPDFRRALENDAPWYIGTCDGRSDRWSAHGLIDDVRIYGRALSGGEVGRIYAESASKVATNCIDECLQALTHDGVREHAREAMNILEKGNILFDSFSPSVVKTVPVCGDTKVDPGTTEIRVTFSKDMMTEKMWSWCMQSADTFPEITDKAGIKYLEDKRTCVLPVKLEPDKTYVIWVNTREYDAFRDTKGNPAIPYFLVFETR